MDTLSFEDFDFLAGNKLPYELQSMPPIRGQVVHGSVIVHDVDLLASYDVDNQEVIRVVGRSDFNHTSTKLRVCVFITNDWSGLFKIE